MKQQILNLKKKLLIVELKTDKPVIEHKKELHTLQLIGKLTDITEEQFRQWVDFVPIVVGLPCLTAKEIFFSYLEKEGIYFENKLGTKESVKNFPEYGLPSWIKNAEAWQEAEEKVWNLNICYIFEVL